MDSVVFIHGLFGSGQDWNPIIQNLKTFNGIALDLPGHGDNKSQLSNYSISSLADWVYEKSLKGPSHYVGYSLGGRILLALNKNHPEIFKSLTLISTSPGLTDEKERAERLNQDLEWTRLWKNLPREKFFSQWYSQDIFSNLNKSPGLVVSRAQNTSEACPQVLLDTSPGQNEPMWSNLKAIFKCLLVIGEEDKKYVALGQSVVAENPRIELKMVPSAGHGVHLEKPQEVSRILKDYLLKEYQNEI
jgi:2-succinyl-6-hydroxy-2,4-cyclohexadiene-1-carboxylate synthase